ncbi:MAG: Uma2 family endonuclease [Tepidiformaceae bacterium]
MAKVAIAPIKLVAKVPSEPGEYVADRKMTFEEYLELDHERGLAEWIDGEVHFYVGASTAHQRLVLFIASLLDGFLVATGRGHAFAAPLVVRAAALGNGREPDIVMVLSRNDARIRPAFVDGPPDIVVEVVSDESVERDYEIKRKEYEAAGVPEYWVIDPREDTRDAMFLILRNGRYEQIEVADGLFRSYTLQGFWLRVAWLWEERLDAFGHLREMLDHPLSD